MTVWVDFETRSRCNLLTAGVYNYAMDASTEVICMCYAIDDGPVKVWTQGPLPDFTGQQIRAHNAAFERLIFWYVLQQEYALEQFYCTAAQARANSMPGSLEDVGRAAKSDMRKDYRGAELIRKLSIPQQGGDFNYDPLLIEEMIDYCKQDVETMRAASKGLRDLSAEELSDYHINERINDRGVLVDLELCRAAIKYSDAEISEIQQIVTEVSGLTSVRSPRMREWVEKRVGPEAIKLMTVYKDGEAKMSIDKSVRASLLILAEENPYEVPPDVAEIIQCADDVWASSVAKFSRLASLADEEDHRVRGAFVFNGGAATGRASSYGAQVHNFTRKCAKEPDALRQAMVRGHEIVPKFGARITDCLKGMLRPALIPAPGKMFVVADWAAIEARCNPWLSNQPQAEQVLDVFRSGKDIYIREAAGIFHCPEDEVDSARRQIGKVAVLSCGYGGGHNAFASMGRNYGVLLPESDSIRTVEAWRRANQWAVRYWQDIEHAYLRAMRNVGHEFTAGRVTYMFDGEHLWYALPSGRILRYPYAKLDGDGVSYLKSSWKPAADATEWPRARLWKGLACENICQATANDILRFAMRQIDDIVLHVHDEIVVETDKPEEVKQTMARVMTTAPEWATGLPLDVEIKVMARYGK